MRAWVRRLAGASVLAAVAACSPAPVVPPTAPPPVPSPWSATRDSVRTLVAAGQHVAADSVLHRFAAAHRGTPDGTEAEFWRAVLSLDPANPVATPRDALVAIDGYLAGGIQQPRYVEALVLRRTAEVLESARNPVVPTPTVTMVPSDSLVRLRAAQDTIRQLRLELERTQAELERIRRRIRP